MNKIQYFQAPIDVKSLSKDAEGKLVKSADGAITIKGYASTKDLDRYDDIVDPKAFDNTLEVYMKNPIMLLQHEAEKPIGKFTSTVVDSKGLEVIGDIMVDTDECMSMVEKGILTAFSIGYIPKKYEIVNAEGTIVATEAGYEPGFGWEDVWFGVTTRTIKELDLIEISVVSTPANPHAIFSIEKSVKNFFDSEKERMLELKKLGERKEIDAPAVSADTADLGSVDITALEVGETAGETPVIVEEVPVVVPENDTPVSETPETETPEAKSVQERKELESFVKKVEGLETQVKNFNEISVKLVELIEGQNEEIKTLRTAIGNIQIRKGLSSLEAPETAPKG